MQLAQFYLAAWMAGGVLAGGSLLVGNFGRSACAAFTPTAFVSACACGLVAGGATGIAAIVLWPGSGQEGSLMPSLAATSVAAVLGAWLQQRAKRRSQNRVALTE